MNNFRPWSSFLFKILVFWMFAGSVVGRLITYRFSLARPLKVSRMTTSISTTRYTESGMGLEGGQRRSGFCQNGAISNTVAGTSHEFLQAATKKIQIR